MVRDIDDVNLFASFYKDNLEGAESYFDLSLLAPAFAAANARRQCKILAADRFTAVSCMPRSFSSGTTNTSTIFCPRATEASAHLGAVSLLLWTGIELANSHGLRFDFDGGITDEHEVQIHGRVRGRIGQSFRRARSTARYQVQRTIRRIPRADAKDFRSSAGPRGQPSPVKRSRRNHEDQGDAEEDSEVHGASAGRFAVAANTGDTQIADATAWRVFGRHPG